MHKSLNTDARDAGAVNSDVRWLIMRDRESDWKKFTKLKKIALEQFCESVLDESRMLCDMYIKGLVTDEELSEFSEETQSHVTWQSGH